MSKQSIPSSRALICPEILRGDIRSLGVSFINFSGTLETGTIEVHVSIQQDILDAFEFMEDQAFPIHSIKPMHEFQNDDDRSMSENNTSVFCFRTVALQSDKLSLHGYGLAIDINPVQNPYINQGRVLPPNGNYDTSKPGTLYANHPVVKFFKERGFIWGGDWDKPYRDYQHFHKELSQEWMDKYHDAVHQALKVGSKA